MGFIVVHDNNLPSAVIDDLLDNGAFRVYSDYAIILRNPTQHDYDYLTSDPSYWDPLSKRMEFHVIISDEREFNEE